MLVVDTADANDVAPDGDSITFVPEPFKLSPLKVGSFTANVTELSELNATPLANVAVPGVVLVDNETEPVVDETVPTAKFNSVAVDAFPPLMSETFPEFEVTSEPANHSPQPLELASGADEPVMLMAPESEEITFVPVVAVPPQPSKTPMWFPVLVTPEARAPSSVIEPVVDFINEVLRVSIPELCDVVPTDAESWPRSKIFPAPELIVPTKRIPEYAPPVLSVIVAVALA
jgi:hypothetical protein